jgi:3-dehydroquinate dehydratase-1
MKIGRVKLGRSPKVVVSFRDGAPSSQIAGLRRAGMELVELRIDLFKRADAAHAVKEARRFAGFGRIATVRSRKEGGAGRLSDAARLEIFKKVMPSVEAVDIELSSGAILKPVIAEARRRKKTVIVSFHDFKKMPSVAVLRGIAKRAQRAGADIVKIAAAANSARDVLTLTEFTLDHPQKNLVTIAMGEKGAATRVFMPLAGSLFTFAHAGKATAPGQLEAAKMLSLLGNIYF